MPLYSCWQALWEEKQLVVIFVGGKEKIELNFYFRTSLWCLKRFLKHFEAPLENVKMKI